MQNEHRLNVANYPFPFIYLPFAASGGGKIRYLIVHFSVLSNSVAKLQHFTDICKRKRKKKAMREGVSTKLQVFNRKNTAYASIDAIFSIKSLQI